MASIKSLGKTKTYLVDNGAYINSRFAIGDIVKMGNDGGVYRYYTGAAKYFHISPTDTSDGLMSYEAPGDYDKCLWVVVNMAVHEGSHTIIYHIVNKEDKHVMIAGTSLKNTYIYKRHLIPLYEQNIGKVLHKLKRQPK